MVCFVVNLAQGADQVVREAQIGAYGPIGVCASGRTPGLLTVDMDPADVDGLKATLGSDLVSIEEHDAPVFLRQEIVDPGLWGLDQFGGVRNDLFAPGVTGVGVTIANIDTPAEDIAEFGGRMSQPTGSNYSPFAPGPNKHGTNTLSCAGGAVHGIAKEAVLLNFTGFDGNGAGSVGNVNTAGTALADYLEDNVITGAVVFMSFTFPGGNAFDALLARLRAAPINAIVIAAAGNGALDLDTAAGVWPAQDPNALTVGAHTEALDLASFTNFGSTVAVYAPGTLLTVGDPAGPKADGGTSFSAPYVAGACALLIEAGHVDPEQVVVDNALNVNGNLILHVPPDLVGGYEPTITIIKLVGVKPEIDAQGQIKLTVEHPVSAPAAVALPPPPPPQPSPLDNDPFAASVSLIVGSQGIDESNAGRTLVKSGVAVSNGRHQFSGNAKITAIDDPAWTPAVTPGFTAEVFGLEFTSLIGQQSVLGGQWHGPTNQRSWLFYMIDSTTLRVLLSGDGQSIAMTRDVAFAPALGQRYDLTWELGTDGEVRIYADGAVLDSAPLAFVPFNASAALEVGAAAGDTIQCSHSLDAIRLTSAARNMGPYAPVNPFSGS